MKAIVRTLLFAIALSFWHGPSYADEDDAGAPKVKIFTPLGHEPSSNTFTAYSNTWSETEIEQSKQAWLYSGGLFKTQGSCTFSEKNNYIPKHSVQCMGISGDNIYVGTKEGIYLSTNYGDSWLSPEEDGIINLEERQILAISVSSNTIFAGTDDGIFKSVNGGESWTQPEDLAGKKITCIEFDNSDNIYVGVIINEPGVWKSTDNGDSWTQKLAVATYCLKYVSGSQGILYAGLPQGQGLRKSTNYGENWLPSIWKEDKVTAIFIDGSNIYIGTEKKGVYRSTNGGGSFSQVTTGLPYIPLTSDYYKINCIDSHISTLYAATENGLYNSSVPSINWLACQVSDNVYKPLSSDIFTKNIHINQDDLWILCDEIEGTLFYSSSTVTENLPPPLDPPNFPNYLCYTFSWHLSEGGVSGVMLNPESMSYTPTDNSTTWNKNNWDYIQETDWSSPLWDKVTYAGHSGIRSPSQTYTPPSEDELLIISKWTERGPLVEHKLRDNPWKSGIKYWKSKKKVTGNITENQEIGRQIITDGETTIQSGSNVQFRIAPMYGHKIHLKPGFHAQAGSTFRAFVDESRSIPWQEDATDGMQGLLAGNFDDANKFKANTVMESYSSRDSFAEPPRNNEYLRFDTVPCQPEKPNFKYSGKGSGTKEDPYQITKLQDFIEMEKDWSGDHYWILMNDIDATETRYWNPVVWDNGDTLWYWGFTIPYIQIRSLDGRGHVIRNLYSKDSFMFSLVNCLSVKRLGFENACLEPKDGGHLFRVDRDDLDFIMEESFITGKMILDSNYKRDIYGFGSLKNNAIIKNCYADLSITTKDSSSITNFTTSFVWNEMVPQVINCYAAGSATSPKVLSPFGYQGIVTSCFWDSETIKVTNDSIGLGLGLSTADMKKRYTFESAGWDFENVWYIEEGMDYPKLRAFKRGTSVEQPEPPPHSGDWLEVSPNPAVSVVTIRYSVSTVSSVKIGITNILGVESALVAEIPIQQAGEYTTSFDVSDLPPGIYFLTLRTEAGAVTKQFAVVR